MSKENNKSILLVGAGQIAIGYSKVLIEMNRSFIVIGRGEISAQKFEKATSIKVTTGGIDKWLSKTNECPKYAIVAVSGEELGRVSRLLIEKGIKKILLEKPGGLNNEDIKLVAKKAKVNNADVVLGYNRHFFASVIKAKEIIAEDNGVVSFTFEFSEWSHVIENLKKSEKIKKLWLLHNSTHVIDLAFFLGGEPEKIACFSAGELIWHSSGAIFTGAGTTKNGQLFSYHSNWDAPGRWGVEILTKEHRLIFRPLEKLQIQKRKSITIKETEIDDSLDKKFKPGLYKQVDAFLNDDYKNFINIYEHIKRLKFYHAISKGNFI